ncbi:MAG: HD family hydrolase [Candidatus Aenigmatarchaeota archaeon]
MEDLLRLFMEMGKLKQEIRSGWKLIDIDNPESVAEHSHRASLIGYFISKEEDVDAEKVLKMLVFHDLAETRIGDIDKVESRYLNKHESEERAIEDQVQLMSEEIGEEYKELMKELNEEETKEAVVAVDADLLECAIQAKEYMNRGYEKAENWIDNVENALKTETARRLLKDLRKQEDLWWKGLKDV